MTILISKWFQKLAGKLNYDSHSITIIRAIIFLLKNRNFDKKLTFWQVKTIALIIFLTIII